MEFVLDPADLAGRLRVGPGVGPDEETAGGIPFRDRELIAATLALGVCSMPG
jgi:hypothetical protein